VASAWRGAGDAGVSESADRSVNFPHWCPLAMVLLRLVLPLPLSGRLPSRQSAMGCYSALVHMRTLAATSSR
jgi:hypothetical protein